MELLFLFPESYFPGPLYVACLICSAQENVPFSGLALDGNLWAKQHLPLREVDLPSDQSG